MAEGGCRSRLAIARAGHRRFGGPAGRGRRGAGVRAGALDAGEPFAAKGHAQACGQGGAAVPLELLFRVSESVSRTAQGGAVSRVDFRGGARFPWAGRFARPPVSRDSWPPKSERLYFDRVAGAPSGRIDMADERHTISRREFTALTVAAGV